MPSMHKKRGHIVNPTCH